MADRTRDPYDVTLAERLDRIGERLARIEKYLLRLDVRLQQLDTDLRLRDDRRDRLERIGR